MGDLMNNPLRKHRFGSKVLAFCLISTLVLVVLGAIPQNVGATNQDHQKVLGMKFYDGVTLIANFSSNSQMVSITEPKLFDSLKYSVQSPVINISGVHHHANLKITSPNATITHYEDIYMTTPPTQYFLETGYLCAKWIDLEVTFTHSYYFNSTGTYYIELNWLMDLPDQPDLSITWLNAIYLTGGIGPGPIDTPAFDAIRIILGTISVIGLVMSPFTIAYQIKHGTSGRIEGALWLLMLLVFFGGFFMAFVYWT